MIEHVFRLGAIDGDHDVGPLEDWLAENTDGGTVSAQTYQPTLIETFSSTTISRRPVIVRVFWEVVVHTDDEAFWVKMRWAEDISRYARNKRMRDEQDASLRKQIEADASQHHRFYPSTHGPSSYSMGAAQSKMMIPLADPAKAAAITETGRRLVRHMLHETKKVILVEGEADFMRIFGGPSDDDISFKGMTTYLSHGSSADDDPER